MLTTHETNLYRRTVFANFLPRFSSYFIIIKFFLKEEKKNIGGLSNAKKEF